MCQVSCLSLSLFLLGRVVVCTRKTCQNCRNKKPTIPVSLGQGRKASLPGLVNVKFVGGNVASIGKRAPGPQKKTVLTSTNGPNAQTLGNGLCFECMVSSFELAFNPSTHAKFIKHLFPNTKTWTLNVDEAIQPTMTQASVEPVPLSYSPTSQPQRGKHCWHSSYHPGIHGESVNHGENGGTLGMVPLIINPIYTLYSGYLLGFIGYIPF